MEVTMIRKWLVLPFVLLFLPGCWNSDNAKHIHFGDVSIGQQMIDLKRALEENAITADEHIELKEALMSLQSVCADEEA
jgi:hypothetical protein